MTHSPNPSLCRGFLYAATLSLATIALPQRAEAAPSPSGDMSGKGGNFGLGLSLGEPTGLSMKLFMHPNHALQWSVGWGPWHWAGRAHMDYLWHPGRFTSNKTFDLVGYIGLGIGAAFWSQHRWNNGYWCDRGNCGGRGGAALLLRIPAFGVSFHWKKVPLDTAIEAAWSPLIDRWGFDPRYGDFLVAGRYYF